MKKVYRFQAGDIAAQERLDQLIAEHCSDISRTLSKKLLDIGAVHVNGRRVRKCSTPLNKNDRVEIYTDGLPLDPYRISASDVIYQDDYLIAINKPPQIETQPTPARYKGTLYEALLLWLKNPYRPLDVPSLGMVQRLDRETSGVMVFSVHPKSHKPVTEAFTQRSVVKTYLALVTGHLPEDQGEFCSSLARNRATNKMKSVAKGGKEAITRYRQVQRFERCTLVEVQIPTGRMHQIRVHFSEAGWPLVGDSRYGSAASLAAVCAPRTMLHSATLECPHPIHGNLMTLHAPLAADFQHLVAALSS